MEMMNVSSQNAVTSKESNSGKKDSKSGDFDTILKTIIPEKESPEGEKEEKVIEISGFVSLGQAIPLDLETGKEVNSETKGTDLLISKVPANDLPEQVKPEASIQKDLVKEILPQTQTLDKTKEVLSQNPQVKEIPGDGFKVEIEPKVFSVAYRELNYTPKTDGEKAEKVFVLGKSTEQMVEDSVKISPIVEKPSIEKSNLGKNQEGPFLSLEKTEAPFKLEVQGPVLKTNQDNISKVQDAMVKLFETSTEGQTSSMKISLHPETLGKVDIGLKMEGGKLTASILVENNQVRDLFTSKLGELNQSLAKQNLVIEKIHVEVKNQGPNLEMNMNQQGNFNQQGKRHKENRMSNIFKNDYPSLKEIESIRLEKGVSILA